MAVETPPQSNDTQSKVEKVIPDLEAAIDKVDDLQQCYEDAATTANKFDEDRLTGNQNVPWAEFVDSASAQRNAFEFIYSEPLQTLMSGGTSTGLVITTSAPQTAATIDLTQNISNDGSVTLIKDFARNIRYDQIFKDHQHFIKGPGNTLSNLLTEARTNLDTFNVVNYQTNLTNAKKLIVNTMIEPVRIFIQSLEVVDSQITNPQSLFYKVRISYGSTATANPETIANYDMGDEMDSLREQAGEIFTKLRDLFNSLDALSKIKEDVLKRVVLSNQGFKEDPNQPGTFAKGTADKDGWGIKFSYRKTLTSREFINKTGQNNALNNSLTQTRTRDTSRQNRLNQNIIDSNIDFIRDDNLVVDKDFYMILLPAIKSNLPVQGGVDVPGAMPGLQFRIENNIVKHKIPGFAPVYQPLGIDCIKCTMVGLFTGHDGVSIDSTLREDLLVSTRAQSLALQKEGEVPKILPFDIVGQAKRGYSDSTFSTPAISDTKDESNTLWNHVPQTVATTGGVSMSYDAFMNAQEFYNEIVSAGVEVEIEINTRSRSGGQPGGAGGPFRDSETGNPKFKALIKRMDMYYVRQDRVYFILDLLITNSGLIGEECINLTNVIEEATETFDQERAFSVESCVTSIDRSQARAIHVGGRRGDSKIIVDPATGVSWQEDRPEDDPGNNAIREGTFVEGSLQGSLGSIQRVALYGLDGYKTQGSRLIINILKQSRSGLSLTERESILSTPITTIRGRNRNIRYNTGTGRWVLFDRDTKVVDNNEEVTFSFDDGLDIIAQSPSGDEKTRNLFSALQEVATFVEFNKPNACTGALNGESTQSPGNQEDTQSPVGNQSLSNIEIPPLDDIINSTNSSIQDNAETFSSSNAPGLRDSPELRDRLSRSTHEDIQGFTKGAHDAWLINGLNDYLSLISRAEDAPAVPNTTLLLSNLVNTTKANTSFFSPETGNINNISVESVTVDNVVGGPGTGVSEGQARFNTVVHQATVVLSGVINGSENFRVSSGNREHVYPAATPVKFTVKVGRYKNNTEEPTEVEDRRQNTYRIQSIVMRVPNFVTPTTATEVVPTADTDAQPGDTNTPEKP